MTEIFLNIYFVQRQALVQYEVNDQWTSSNSTKELKLGLEDKIYVVGGGRIPMTDESSVEDVWRSLWDFAPKSFSRAKRTLTLRAMFPNHVEDELHLLVVGPHVPRINVYYTNRRIQYFKAETPLLDQAHQLLPEHFSNEEMTAIQFIRPARPIFEDGKIDIDATVKTTVDAVVGTTVDVGGQGNPCTFPWNATLEDALPWGGFSRHISLIAYLPGLEGDDILTELPTVRRQRFFDKYPCKAPSSEGVPERFRTAQKNPLRTIYCGRQAEDAVPASLLDENLCKFQRELKTCVPSPDDITLFRKMRATLTAIFEKEDERKEALMAILRDLIPSGTSLHVGGIGPFLTDGDIRVSFQGVDYLLLIEEVKNEAVGASAEPYFQGIHHWLASVDSCLKQLNQDQKQRINFPTLILSHFGPYLTIAAATFGDSPNVETLVTLSLHVHSTNTDALAEGERMVCALRKCLHDMFHYYANLVTTDSCQTGFPFRNYFISDGIKKYFVYDKCVPEKRLFFAHSEQAPHTRFCIKFSRRYSEAAHRAAAELGFAPRLYAVDTFYGWYMVVMEDLSTDYVRLDTLPGHGLGGHITDAVSNLHAAGFVHGDLRDLNILVRKSSAPTTLPGLQLVDFDWAGKLGEATYPHGMNPVVERAADAIVGGIITAEHDMYMVSLL